MQPTAPPPRRDLPSLPPRFALCIARCGERIGLPRTARAPDAHAHTSLLPPAVLPIWDEGTEGMRRDSFLLSSADTPWLPHLPFGSPIRILSLVHTSPSPRRHELHKSPVVVASRSISPSVAISIMYPLLTSWPERRQKPAQHSSTQASCAACVPRPSPTLFQPSRLAARTTSNERLEAEPARAKPSCLPFHYPFATRFHYPFVTSRAPCFSAASPGTGAPATPAGLKIRRRERVNKHRKSNISPPMRPAVRRVQTTGVIRQGGSWARRRKLS